MNSSDLKLLAEIEGRDKRIADLEHSRATLVELRDKRIADLERLLKVRTEALENISTVRVQDYLPAHRAVAYCRDVAIAALSQGTGGT